MRSLSEFIATTLDLDIDSDVKFCKGSYNIDNTMNIITDNNKIDCNEL